MRDYAEQVLVPAIGNIVTWLAENIPNAITIAAGFWTNTLQPALSGIWNFITDKVVPAFSTMWTWLALNIPAAMVTFYRHGTTPMTKKSVDNFWKSLTNPTDGFDSRSEN